MNIRPTSWSWCQYSEFLRHSVSSHNKVSIYCCSATNGVVVFIKCSGKHYIRLDTDGVRHTGASHLMKRHWGGSLNWFRDLPIIAILNGMNINLPARHLSPTNLHPSLFTLNNTEFAYRSSYNTIMDVPGVILECKDHTGWSLTSVFWFETV